VRRFIPVVAVAILLAGILSDPYTYALNGSDAVMPAPVWQLSFAILDIGLLFGIAALGIRCKTQGALLLLVLETIYYVAGNAVLILRDGPARFAHGFGAESNLTEHLIAFALRLVLLGYLAFSHSRSVLLRDNRRADAPQ
jgi:hypothetical protein